MAAVLPTKTFLKNLKSLPPDRQKGVSVAIAKFLEEPATPSLRFRSLKGVTGHFIINARHGDRIILREAGPERFEIADVGPHDNVYRRWDR